MAQRATGQHHTLVQVQRGRLKLPTRRWKCKWRIASCSWYAKLGSLHTEKINQLANLLFDHSAEGDGAISPSFSTVNGSIDASSSSLEAPIATHHIRGGKGGGAANGSIFTTANKYLFADLLFFIAGEGNKAMSTLLSYEK